MKKSKPQPKPSAKKERIEKQRKPSRERHPDIAVIGMACRFPGAKDYTEFWENLREGRSSIQEIPPERWDWKAYWGDPQGEANKSNSKWGGFVEDVDAFDTGFFGLSARDQEGLSIGVNGDELDTTNAGLNHAVDGVNSASTDTNNLDDGQIVLRGGHTSGHT